jgi:hypothetical protein
MKGGKEIRGETDNGRKIGRGMMIRWENERNANSIREEGGNEAKL